MSKEPAQLPRVAFSILLALSLKERHGYEIIKQVEEDSHGKIKLGPGALYTSIKQLHKNGLIAEVNKPEATARRCYKLTGAGTKVLRAELEYYENAVQLAKHRRLVNTADYA
jgi:DNA-binding PadR family transcriptional regulator